MQSLKVGDYCDTGISGSHEVVCLQVHGDAAFSGQVIIEMLISSILLRFYSLHTFSLEALNE